MPVLPAAACSPAAASVAAGIGPVCQAVAGATGAVGSAAGQAAGFGVDSVLDALGSWVASGATWLLDQIGGAVGASTTVDVGASWFSAHYAEMAALSGVVIVPMFLLGVVQAVYRQSAAMLLRSVLVNVPLAIVLTAVAVKLVGLGLALVDALSNAVASGAGIDGGHFLSGVSLGLTTTDVTTGGGVPAVLVFVGGLVVVAGALLIWVELLVRAAAVYVAVLFLPLALASLAWPAIAHWCRRLVDTLAALVLSKFVIVSVLGLAAGALAGGSGSPAPGSGGSFTAVLGGAALLLLAAFAPWALFRLLPFLEAGAVGHLEALGQRARQSGGAPVRSLAHQAMNTTARLAFDSLASDLGAGTATSGSLATGAHGIKGGSGGRSGAGVSRAHGADPGDAAPNEEGGVGTAPDDERSSAATTGVGTMSPPGYGIPMMEPNREASAVTGPDEWSGSARSAEPSTTLVPLPRATGTDLDHFLGRDELGPKLVAGPRPRPAPDDGGGSPTGGGHGG